jgi:tetratricopeptide (TPR) repeat protein
MVQMKCPNESKPAFSNKRCDQRFSLLNIPKPKHKSLTLVGNAHEHVGVKFLISVILLLLFFIPFGGAVAQNYTPSDKAMETGSALVIAEAGMAEMVSRNLSVTRYNDTLVVAKQVYNAQMVLEKTGEKPDYSFVQEKITEMNDIKVKAFRTLDELSALKLTIEQTADVNKSVVQDIYAQANVEFESERYEEALKLIDKAYEKISELEAIEAKLRAFYEATSRGIAGFLQEWWKELIITISIIVAIVVLTYNKIICKTLERRIRNLEARKQSIRKLIADTQKDYFESGKIPEETYRIRTKKYAEFIRDINRQIPLVQEELTIRRRRRI